jgi:hypothetical protein
MSRYIVASQESLIHLLLWEIEALTGVTDIPSLRAVSILSLMTSL